MTPDDQEKCSEMFQMAFNEYIPPFEWCDKAGDALAEFFAAMSQCSYAMSFVPRPPGMRPGYQYLVDYVYQVLIDRGSEIYNICLTAGLGAHKRKIKIELIGCS